MSTGKVFLGVLVLTFVFNFMKSNKNSILWGIDFKIQDKKTYKLGLMI
jgi:hypothetical protein